MQVRRKGREGYFDEVLLQHSGSRVVLSGGIYFSLELL